MKKNRNLIICSILFSLPLFSQIKEKNKFHFPEIKTGVHQTKSGPFFGIEKGKYTAFTIGFEKQWKNKLIKPETNALRFGIDYGFKTKILGYKVGYWHKKGRLNFTYGADLCLRSDFDQSKIGFAPTIGYKIGQFHFQTGYHFYTKSQLIVPSNTFFLSLRLVIINRRKLELD
jgi:hypothetical protein